MKAGRRTAGELDRSGYRAAIGTARGLTRASCSAPMACATTWVVAEEPCSADGLPDRLVWTDLPKDKLGGSEEVEVLRFFAGVCVGALAVSLFAVLLGRSLLADKYEFGRHVGQLDGRLAAMQAIREEFGEVPWSPQFTALFSLKTSVAVATTIDGVKTIRVVP